MLMIFVLGQGMHNETKVLIEFFSIAFLIILAFFMYLLFTFISTIATKRIIQQKPLTRIQKFSTVIFPLITIPLYSFFIFHISDVLQYLISIFGFAVSLLHIN